MFLCVSDGAYSNILVNKKMKQLNVAEKKMKLSRSRPCVTKSSYLTSNLFHPYVLKALWSVYVHKSLVCPRSMSLN